MANQSKWVPERALIALDGYFERLSNQRSVINVLVVDDEPSDRGRLVRMLKEFLCDVSEAKDGMEALELPNCESFDFVFVDMRMPGIDGVEFIEKFRGLNSRAWFTILTRFDDHDAIRHAVETGPVIGLSKPITREWLERILNSFKG